MKIAVVGNCQCRGFSNALRANVADAQIDTYNILAPGATDAAAEALPSYDLVFSQKWGGAKGFECFESARLQQTVRRLQFYPPISFTGFHPDFLYISNRNGQPVQCPTGPYNSRLVAACYSLGLTPRRTASLFNSYIYRLLGYFDAFAASTTFIVRKGAEIGFDLSREIVAWTRDDGFMHTINHPKQRVLDALMRLAAAKAELRLDSPTLVSPDDFLARSFVLPVYPEIAQHLNVTGSLSFKCRLPADGEMRPAIVPLVVYIEETYRMYRDAGISPAELSQPIAKAAAVINDAIRTKAARGAPEKDYKGREAIEQEVTALYRAILLREPDPSGLKSYVALIESGSASLSAVVVAMLRSKEFAFKTNAFLAAYTGSPPANQIA